MQQGPDIHSSLTAFASLNILDMASTWVALQAGLAEGNALPSMLLANIGEPAMYLFKATITLLIMVAVIRLSPYYRRMWYGIRVANGLLILTVLQNTLWTLLAL